MKIVNLTVLKDTQREPTNVLADIRIKDLNNQLILHLVPD
jgi:hypothetical protein